jgi:hypothetical protein
MVGNLERFGTRGGVPTLLPKTGNTSLLTGHVVPYLNAIRVPIDWPSERNCCAQVGIPFGVNDF